MASDHKTSPDRPLGWSFQEFHQAAYHAAYEGFDPKSAARLYSLYQQEVQWQAEMAAKAAREATRWFRFKAGTRTTLEIAGSLLSIFVAAVIGGVIFYYGALAIRTPFELVVVVLLGAILLAVVGKS